MLNSGASIRGSAVDHDPRVQVAENYHSTKSVTYRERWNLFAVHCLFWLHTAEP